MFMGTKLLNQEGSELNPLMIPDFPEVRSVNEDHKSAGCGTDEKNDKIFHAVVDRCRKKYTRRNRSGYTVVAGQHQNHGYGEQPQKYSGVIGNDHTGESSNTFSTVEFEKQRKNMSGDCTQSGKKYLAIRIARKDLRISKIMTAVPYFFPMTSMVLVAPRFPVPVRLRSVFLRMDRAAAGLSEPIR